MTTTTPAPIPTEWRGITFRSRLEARWAMFFDGAGIAWEYEAEAYELPSGRYLPDFWLPAVVGPGTPGVPGVHFEVKGTEPTDAEMRRCFELSDLLGGGVAYVAWGGLPTAPYDVLAPAGTVARDIEFVASQSHDMGYWFCDCTRCGTVGVQFEARAERNCRCHGPDKVRHVGQRLTAAMEAARTHRWWNP